MRAILGFARREQGAPFGIDPQDGIPTGRIDHLGPGWLDALFTQSARDQQDRNLVRLSKAIPLRKLFLLLIAISFVQAISLLLFSLQSLIPVAEVAYKAQFHFHLGSADVTQTVQMNLGKSGVSTIMIPSLSERYLMILRRVKASLR